MFGVAVQCDNNISASWTRNDASVKSSSSSSNIFESRELRAGKKNGLCFKRERCCCANAIIAWWQFNMKKRKRKGRTNRSYTKDCTYFLRESQTGLTQVLSRAASAEREKKGEKTSCVCKLLLLSYLVGYQHNNITTGYRQTHTQGTRTRSLLTRLSSGWLSVARPQANNYHLSCWLVITVNWWEEDDIIIRIRIGAGQQSKRRPLT